MRHASFGAPVALVAPLPRAARAAARADADAAAVPAPVSWIHGRTHVVPPRCPPLLIELIERLGDLPRPAFNKVLQYLSSEAVRSLPEVDRSPIWQGLADLVSKHRQFSDADWAMPQDLVTNISDVADAIAPRSPELLYQRLFGSAEWELITEHEGDYDSKLKRVELKRQAAVSEILKTRNLETVLKFAQAVAMPWKVGTSLGAVAPPEIDAKIIPSALESNVKSLLQFAGGFVWERFRTKGWLWVTEILEGSWTLTQQTSFLTLLPFEKTTWDLCERLLGYERAKYWAQTPANPGQAQVGDLPTAIDNLLLSNRPSAALQCLDWLIRKKALPEPELAIRVLEELVKEGNGLNAVDFHSCADVIRWLQESLPDDSIALQRIEWAYLPLLKKERNIQPRTLERCLATSPEFFSEVVRTAFRSEDVKSPPEPSENERKIAQHAYQLIRDWRTIPGTKDDGTVDEAELGRWLDMAKEICKQSGHLHIAVHCVGRVLSYAPADPDGSWICHAAARILEAEETEEMRKGFSSGILDSRGAYWGTQGSEERKLADAYRKKAEAIDYRYPRLATTVRKIAQWYASLAEHDAATDLQID